MVRRTSSIAVVVGILALGATAGAQHTCDAGKIGCVAKLQSCLLKVEGRALQKGVPVDTAKRQRCHDKFDGGVDPTRGCIGKLEGKQDPGKPETLCTVPGDTASLRAAVEAFVADALAEVALDYPTVEPPNKCHAALAKCIEKKGKCELKIHQKAIKLGQAPVGEKLAKCQAKFLTSVPSARDCLDKVYGRQKPAKPETLCDVPDDGANLEATVDAFLDDTVRSVTCGNGIQQVGEECDGADVGPLTCNLLGYSGDGLACTPSCELDVSGCGPLCVPGSQPAGPGCWRIAIAENCDESCAEIGQTCNAATMDAFGGANGTDEECNAALVAAGQIVLSVSSGPSTIGCAYDPFAQVGLRGTLPTDCAIELTLPAMRACACE